MINIVEVNSMAIKTVDDIYNNILRDFGVKPIEYTPGENFIRYKNITFSKNTGSILLSNKTMGEMFAVARNGHSLDYMRPDELENAISKRGSLPYFFV